MNNIIAIATIEGDLITINSENGEIIQTLGLDEALTSQLVIIETIYNGAKTKAIIVGSSSGKVYCYELTSLELIWVNDSAERMIETLPLVIDDKIIYGSWDNYLYCISKNSIQIKCKKFSFLLVNGPSKDSLKISCTLESNAFRAECEILIGEL